MENVIKVEDLKSLLIGSVKVKKEKIAKIVCKIDGELMEFKNEKTLKKFIWKERPENIIKYELAGEVVVPFELEIIKDKQEQGEIR